LDDSKCPVDCDSSSYCWVSSVVDCWTLSKMRHSLAVGSFSAWAEGRACKVRTWVEVIAFCGRRD
jgi:hypothetical protein